MTNPREFTLTVTCNEGGFVKIRDSRVPEGSEMGCGKGVLVLIGDENTGQYNVFGWGHYRSIVFGMYSAIMWAKDDKTQDGEHYRTILGMISRMILQLYDYMRNAKELTPEGALTKWASEDDEKNKETSH